MNYPSIKTFSRIDASGNAGTGDAAAVLRALITGKKNPEDFPAVRAWIGQCFNRPPDDELIMCAANAVIGGHGVEALRCDGYHGPYWHDIHADYVNQGDTYITTLIRDHSGRFIVASWGDYVESLERRAGGCRFQ